MQNETLQFVPIGRVRSPVKVRRLQSFREVESEIVVREDLVEALEKIAPSDRPYHHDQRWGDGNGFSHLRAALVGPSLTVPVAAGRCITGTWQQIVLVECDLAPRRRRIVLSFVGDCDRKV